MHAPSGTPRRSCIEFSETEGQILWGGIMRCHSIKQHVAFYAGASNGCKSFFFPESFNNKTLQKHNCCFSPTNVYGKLPSDCRWIISLLHPTLDTLYNLQCHRG